MNPVIRIPHLVRQLLPPHKRQARRLALLQAFLSPAEELFREFMQWRSNIRMMVNVNCQVKVFEGYLRKKYKEPIAIQIVTFSDGLLPVGLEIEGITMMPDIGLEEEAHYAPIPLDGELRERFGGVDFIVYLPATLDPKQIEAEIEKYKQVLTQYKIIQN